MFTSSSRVELSGRRLLSDGGEVKKENSITKASKFDVVTLKKYGITAAMATQNGLKAAASATIEFFSHPTEIPGKCQRGWNVVKAEAKHYWVSIRCSLMHLRVLSLVS